MRSQSEGRIAEPEDAPVVEPEQDCDSPVAANRRPGSHSPLAVHAGLPSPPGRINPSVSLRNRVLAISRKG